MQRSSFIFNSDSILASKLMTHLLKIHRVLNYLQNLITEKTENRNLNTDCNANAIFSSPSKLAIKTDLFVN